MKKVLVILCLLFSCCYAAEWLQILDKKYIDLETITTSNANYVSFWIKTLRKQDEELEFIGKNFWYSLDKWTIDCKNRKDSIDVIMIYDLKEKLIYSDELPHHDWHSIAPGTYADVYYRYFCLIPFKENPLLHLNKN